MTVIGPRGVASSVPRQHRSVRRRSSGLRGILVAGNGHRKRIIRSEYMVRVDIVLIFCTWFFFNFYDLRPRFTRARRNEGVRLLLFSPSTLRRRTFSVHNSARPVTSLFPILLINVLNPVNVALFPDDSPRTSFPRPHVPSFQNICSTNGLGPHLLTKTIKLSTLRSTREVNRLACTPNDGGDWGARAVLSSRFPSARR